MKKSMIRVIFLTLGVVVLLSFVISQKPWEVPAKYKTMKNPSPDAVLGKTLWAQHCKSCHGKDGLGDGPKAADLETPSGDFSTAKFQAQSDGELYYKTVFGRGDMPSYDKKLPNEDDRWALVSFMKTLKK